MTVGAIAALYQLSASAMPDAPAFSRPLAAPALWTLIVDAVESVGYSMG